MSATKASTNSIATFAKYDKASAGNPATGVFALQGGGSATHYVSSDGITWTANALSSGQTTSWSSCYYWSAAKTWVFTDSGLANIIYSPSASFTAKVRGQYFASWGGGITPNVSRGYTDTGIDLLIGCGNSKITDLYGAQKNLDVSGTANMLPPAYDGITTWLVVRAASITSGRYSTGDSITGDGLLPYEVSNTGKNGYATWNQCTLPTDANQWYHSTYYNGYWYLITNAANPTIYYTSNIATATPSWTSQTGTISGLNTPFFKVNNELWILPFSGSGSTAYKITAGAGSWSAITLPSSKQCTGIAYGNGAYVISCSDGTVLRSITGASGSFTAYSTGAVSTSANQASVIGFGAA